MTKDKANNPMRKKIFVEKVVINIGCAGDREKIERALKLINKITGRKPVVTKSRKRSTFGIARGRPVGVKVTLRGRDAVEFLKKALKAVDNKLKASGFDDWGNVSFGVSEYIYLPEVKYDPDIGILGMDVCVSLRRPGAYLKNGRLSRRQRVTKEEAIDFMKKTFNVDIA
ncbi:MAG: 50S ribosomal protein L5 [Candidatus Aenigmarchaeota archaeon]|nr:50S ribosomal protein L5 [Candidatus Aenigmarchaeota archaeon]